MPTVPYSGNVLSILNLPRKNNELMMAMISKQSVIENIWDDSVERVSKPNTPATGMVNNIIVPAGVKR